MNTFILTIDDKYEDVLISLATALNFELEQITEEEENLSIYTAMEFGKHSGRMTSEESEEFIEGLSK